MNKLILMVAGLIVFAAINPSEVHAETVEPPTVAVDGIVQFERDMYSPLPLIPYPEHTPALFKVPTVKPRSAIPGNAYTPGNCTWYAKSRRMDLPNNLGNADTWYDAAYSQGVPVGNDPQIGAIGMTRAYMHVVYIESVNKNGSVNLSEMNYAGLGVVSSRVNVPASEFLYIY